MDFSKKNRVISIFIIFILGVHTFSEINNNKNLVLQGDGLEYLLITEAFSNHLSADIQEQDILGYKSEIRKFNKWEMESKNSDYDNLLRSLQYRPIVPYANFGGFSNDKNGKCYSIHFYTYSLFVLPVKKLLAPFIIHPVKVLWYANALFFLIAIYIVLFFNSNKEFFNVCVALLFYYSTTQWYVIWPHPEALICSLLFIGLWLSFISKKPYWGLFLSALAATQFQPLALITVMLALKILFAEGVSVKVLLKLFFCSLIVLVPSVFYYYHFGVTNLVSELGYLDSKYMTFNRTWGFFFDFNQGLIISFTVLLIVYLSLLSIVSAQRIKRKEWKLFDFSYFILPIAVIVVVISTSMANWNGGGANNHRYVNYVGTLILFHFIYLLWTIKHDLWQRIMLLVTVVSQMYVINFFGGFRGATSFYEDHKSLPRYILNNFPEYYNPDPWIFIIRTDKVRNMEFYSKGVVYVDDNWDFKKALVNKDSMDYIRLCNLTKDQVVKLIDGKSDQYGCIYINEGEVKNSLSPQQYIEFNKYVKVNEIRNEMIVKSDFTDQLKLQSGEDQNLYNELLEKEVWKIYQEKF